MSRTWAVALFSIVATSLIVGLHYYLWTRTVRDVQAPASWRRPLRGLFVGMGVLLPASLFLGRTLPRDIASFLVWPASIWLGTLWLTFVVTIWADLVRAIHLAGHHLLSKPLDPSRRAAISRLLGIVSATAGLGAGLWALSQARFRVKPVSINLKRLPEALDGLRIAQLSDIHVGPTIGRDFIEDLVQQTNALAADLVVITGDLVDGSVEQLGPHVAPLAKLKAPLGVFFVTGNHDYYSGADSWCAELKRLGIHVLRNEHTLLVRDGGTVALAGVNDYHGGRFGDAPNLEQALSGLSAETPVVLLAHQPRALAEAATRGVDLQLSGHTHGGQLWPFNFFVRLQQPVVSGLARNQDTQIYVSNGTGYWGPPMRLGAPAEISDITLRSGAT